jgi:hypothetical protein
MFATLSKESFDKAMASALLKIEHKFMKLLQNYIIFEHLTKIKLQKLIPAI